MKTKTGIAIGLLAFSPLTFWLVACGSDTPVDTDGGGGMDATVADTGTNTDTGTVMDTGTMMDTGTDGGGPIKDNCGDAGNGMACRACCRNSHQQGVQTILNAQRTCICSGNKCPSCSGNYCDGGMANNQCDTCGTATLNPDGGACFGPVLQACSNSPDCVAYLQCLNKCP